MFQIDISVNCKHARTITGGDQLIRLKEKLTNHFKTYEFGNELGKIVVESLPKSNRHWVSFAISYKTAPNSNFRLLDFIVSYMIGMDGIPLFVDRFRPKEPYSYLPGSEEEHEVFTYFPKEFIDQMMSMHGDGAIQPGIVYKIDQDGTVLGATELSEEE